MRLRSYDSSPPAWFSPTPSSAPKPRNFPAQPLIEAQARIVLDLPQGQRGWRAPRMPSALWILTGDTLPRGLETTHYFALRAQPIQQRFLFAANAPGLVPCAGCGAKV